MLEEVEINKSEAEAALPDLPFDVRSEVRAKPSRQPLPDHLPREDRIYEAPCACPDCGGTSFLKAPDGVHEVLDYVPASFKVVRHIESVSFAKAAMQASPVSCQHFPLSAASQGLAFWPMC